jgi:DNA primase
MGRLGSGPPRRDALLTIPPAVYVRDLLGVTPGRNRKVRCPFHDDARPSLHVYPTGERGWCCFSCRRGGTIYDLAAKVWGLQTRGGDFGELRRRLMDIYRRELAVHRGFEEPTAAR